MRTATTDETEVLPRAAESEVYCLACMVIWPERAGEIFALLSRNDFVDPLHRDIFTCFEEQYRNGGIDLKFARQRLDLPHSTYGDFTKDYFDDLADAASNSAFIPIEAEKIIEARRKRDRYDHFQTLAKHSLNGWTAEQLDRENESAIYDWKREREAAREPEIQSLHNLCIVNPDLSLPVVDGLLRQGETGNIIADSKANKSWLGYGLLWSIVTGQFWLGRFPTTKGRVLLIDNELHTRTLANRIPKVAKALGIEPGNYRGDFDVWSMRGRLRSLGDIAATLQDIEPNTYAMILLDAKYRLIMPGKSENDNASETEFYNLIDQIAEHTGAAIVLIHHASKGDQSGKKVTDIGSGAGAQSRATDCHLIVRPHEDPGIAVIEAAVRSFAPVDPLPIAWEFPLWRPAFGVDPGKLKGKQTRGEERQTDKDREGINQIIDALRKGGPGTTSQLRKRSGIGADRIERLLGKLYADGNVTTSEVTVRGNPTQEYCLVKSEDE